MRLALPLAVVALSVSACSWFDESPPRPMRAAPQTRAEPVAQPPARPADQCLILVGQGLTAIRRSPQGATADWRVQLQNSCPQPIPALVEFWVLDRNNAAIGYEARRVTAPANAAFEASGQIAVPRTQSETIASTITRHGADTTQAASPAPIDAPTDSGARGAPSVSIVVGVMNWQGNVAMAAVGILNGTSAPTSPFDLTCEFAVLDRVLGTDRQRVPALRPGEQVNVTVTADVGGQLIDSVRCGGG